ncbi:SOS response-associated peptidase [Caloranaerobacter sp. DY30410]|uniref:SOS response-associated peptidase n=1 Tax=Caloranaerobacter sp. DY30410 TaxID=3238305 RepID=UPI003D01F4E9
MCGRYYLFTDIGEISKRFNINYCDILIKPMAEIFPSNEVPIIINNEKGKMIKLMKWGFNLPYLKKLIINARSETIDTKKLFKYSFYNKRCLIPASGFFEWKKENGKNIKYKIYLKDESLFSMAGIYSFFRDKNGEYVNCFTILTTNANKKISSIHNRMPVILDRESEQIWLNNSIKDESLKELLKPIDDVKVEISRV